MIHIVKTLKPMKLLKLTGVIFLVSFILNVNAQSNSLSDTIDVIHYSIHLDLSDVSSHEISGHAEIEFTTPLDYHDELILELKDLTVTSVQVDGDDYSFTHENGRIKVELVDEYVNGEVLTAIIHYEGEPFHEAWGGFHYSGSRCFNLGVGFESDPHNLGKAWFPCVDDFIDRALYDYYITVDESNKAVCGGVLNEVIDNGDGTNTYHWEMEYTIPTYLASVAVGDYELVEDTYSGVNNEIPIEYWVYPGEVNNVEGSFVNMHQVMEAFETHWGPYPFTKVGYVTTGIGAMEHAGNIAYPSGSINGNTSLEWLYAHELAHMWFGNMVTCSSAEDMWLNEGWAVFNESLMKEYVYGPEAYRENINVLHKEVLTKAHTSSGDGSYLALYGIPNDLTYGMTVYDKGGLVTHTLRYYLGDDLFFPAMRDYLQEYAYSPASSWDLRDFLTEHTGVDVSDFFEGWVFQPGFPSFEIDSTSYNNGMTTVFAGQKVRGTDILHNSVHLKIAFLDEDWNIHTDEMDFSGETGSKNFNLGFEPLMVMADYYDQISDGTIDRDKIIKETGEIDFTNTYFKAIVENVMDSSFVRVTHNFAAPDVQSEPWSGVTLSDQRYWRIDGVIEDEFKSQGMFYFNTISSLDKALFQNNPGDVTLLYREGPGYDWRIIPFTIYGPGTFGYLIIDDLKMGEYTIASINEDFIGINYQKKQKYKVFPNPSSDYFNFNVGDTPCEKIVIYNEAGQLIETINDIENNIQWKPLNNGVYHVLFYGDELEDHKVVFLD